MPTKQELIKEHKQLLKEHATLVKKYKKLRSLSNSTPTDVDRLEVKDARIHGLLSRMDDLDGALSAHKDNLISFADLPWWRRMLFTREDLLYLYNYGK